MAQSLGVIDIIVGGKTLNTEKGAKIKLGGYKQNPVLLNGKVDYCKEFEATEITCTMVFERGQKIGDVFAAGTQEVQANCDTGQSFILADGFVMNRPEMTGGEGGKIEVKISGGTCQELMNG